MTDQPVALVLDSSPARSRLLAEALAELGYAPIRLSAEALAESEFPLDAAFALVPIDEAGLAAVAALLESDPLLPILAHAAELPSGEEARRLGRANVHDVLELPHLADLAAFEDRLLAATRRSASRRSRTSIAPEIVGSSGAMDQVRRYIARAAASDANVLISGESGTGKELVARAIHRHGPRSTAPFVAVNCSAIPETLLESELFGHEKGAFTDAVQRSRGRFETAAGGTLFFDEIGDLPPSVQAKLLRVLQPPSDQRDTCREFTLVGGEGPLRADVRCVFATHQDLRRLRDEGSFREDLLQRIEVLRIEVPPLRERREDIPQLAEYLLERACAREGRAGLHLDALAMEVLQAYDHPRNVRELRGLLHSIVVLKEHGDTIVLGDLPRRVFDTRDQGIAPESAERAGDAAAMTLVQVVSRHVRRTLQEAGGNKSLAARRLGISRPTLDRKLDQGEPSSACNES